MEGHAANDLGQNIGHLLNQALIYLLIKWKDFSSFLAFNLTGKQGDGVGRGWQAINSKET